MFSLRKAAAVFAAAVMMSGLSAAGYAADMKAAANGINQPYSGWVTENGAHYYYKDGVMLKNCWLKKGGDKYFLAVDGSRAEKNTTIGGIRYKFGADGKCRGKFSGFSTRSGKRYYYLDGKKQTGWFKRNGNSYYADYSGAVVIDEIRIINGYVYRFDENGIWNGEKQPYKEYVLSLRVNTLGELINKYLCDDYDMEVKYRMSGTKKPINLADSEKIYKLLSDAAKKPLTYFSSENDCEQPEIKASGKELVLRFVKKGEKYASFYVIVSGNLIFDTGHAINSWYAKLDDSGLYDILLARMKKK